MKTGKKYANYNLPSSTNSHLPIYTERWIITSPIFIDIISLPDGGERSSECFCKHFLQL